MHGVLSDRPVRGEVGKEGAIMIDPNKPGNVFCKGRPNPKIAQMLDDWLFDCRMVREAESPACAGTADRQMIAQDASAVSDSVEVRAEVTL